MRLEAAPNWREINRNPRWLQWLQEIDSLSGRTKQQGTRREKSRSSVASSKRWAKLLDGPDRRGPKSPFIRALRLLSSTVRTAKVRTFGREAEWARQDADIIAAGREGRIRGAEPVLK
jgi:hypothetical protein